MLGFDVISHTDGVVSSPMVVGHKGTWSVVDVSCRVLSTVVNLSTVTASVYCKTVVSATVSVDVLMSMCLPVVVLYTTSGIIGCENNPVLASITSDLVLV